MYVTILLILASAGFGTMLAQEALLWPLRKLLLGVLGQSISKIPKVGKTLFGWTAGAVLCESSAAAIFGFVLATLKGFAFIDAVLVAGIAGGLAHIWKRRKE